MTSTQLAHAVITKMQSIFFVLTGSFFCLFTGIIYGLTVNIIEVTLAPLQIWQPHPLNAVHVIAITLIFCIWIGLNLKPFTHYEESLLWRRFYVGMLNASQPHPKTMTSSRNGYKF